MNRSFSYGGLLRTASLLGLASAFSCDSANVFPQQEVTTDRCDQVEFCCDPDPAFLRMRWEPRFVVLAPGQKRKARLVVDPDFCAPTEVTFTPDNVQVVSTPSGGAIDYGQPIVEIELQGLDKGVAHVQPSLMRDGADLCPSDKDTRAKWCPALEVEVMDATKPACTAEHNVATAEVAPGAGPLQGENSLGGASIELPAGADEQTAPSVVWTVGAFDAGIECADDIVPTGYTAMGPAVRFTSTDRVFPRELPVSIPVNPALLPDKARWRHLRVAYQGPRFREPRAISVTDPRVEKIADGSYRLRFKTHRFGTYQAIVKPQAGATRARRITHRAIVGVSMGGVGAAQIGLRHHHLFDVVAALGGPVDWTWMLGHIEQNQVGGFRSIPPGTQVADIQLQKTACTTTSQCASDETCVAGGCTLLPPVDEPYEHAATYDNWWYEPNDVGNGSDFARRDYTQMFRDIALVYGNPLGYNPLALNLPAGVDPDHPSQTGAHDGGVCKIFVKPYDGPDKELQEQLWNTCPLERCANQQTLTGYYDDEYNPDGTFPVITYCDGSPQDEALSPYASSWSARGNDWPAEVGLAVDYNNNGVRDELEPVIKSGHERWDDWGTDQTPSVIEPGYGPNNLDPSGDDYDPQFNPTGTEGDGRYQEGEPFDDDGLDGVPGTAASPYDFGEGDGVFTASPGWQRFWDYDPRGMTRGWSDLPDAPLDDAALARVDLWTDGGIRDLFNFYLPARHLAGAFQARGRAATSFSKFFWMPGLDPALPNEFNPAHTIWEEMQDVVLARYGEEEPTAEDLAEGTGMHVGTVNEIFQRIQSSLYFIASRWPDAPRTQVVGAVEKPAEGVDPCEVDGTCRFTFTSSFGRSGPVSVNLPPGYAHADLQSRRYPVLYLLHGYGMEPADLEATIVILRNWMNQNTDSQASRLAKMIVVYPDGRCRWKTEGDPESAECIRGNFYADSLRPEGGQIDAWFLELADYIDQRFRTMGEATIEWPE